MLQRIQTIWLLFAATCIFLALKFPTFNGTTSVQEPDVDVSGVYSIPLLACSVALGVMTAIAIFLFKNRKTQLTVVIFAILVQVLLLFLYYLEYKKFLSTTISIFSVLHLLVIACLVLAARGINADEKLIKESSRLR